MYQFTTKIGFIKTFIGVLFVLFSFFSYSSNESALVQVQNFAEQHVLDITPISPNGELSVNAAQLDSRIKVSTCPSGLEASSPTRKSNSANVTVLVKCSEEDWQVYVPVRTTLLLPFVVASSSLSKGQLLSEASLGIKLIEQRSYRREGFTDTQFLIGAKLKRNIQEGQVIERRDICTVCRNEKVVIKAIKEGMTISTKGTALSDAALGEQVKVKNDKSQRIIEGIVTDVAEITVYF
mgnify:CR=1 FL=1